MAMALEPDPASFEAVVLPHLDAATNLARWLVRNDEDARDVLQEAVLRALTYFGGFRGINARAWLLQIVRNTAYDSFRLNRGIQLVPMGAAAGVGGGEFRTVVQLPDPGDDPEIALIKEDGRRQLDRALERLEVELREVLVLRELEGLSYKDIAQITDVPIGTVMSRLWRARRMLAKGMVKSAGKGGDR
jgi:RNA polymerase sigma-70 factor (ECF subfamily)